MEKHNETEQEKKLRDFLIQNGLAFEQHKRMVGDGEKIWIVDFYLPDHSIIIEAKTISWLRQKANGCRMWGEGSLGGIYKDLYKMDELIRRYNLIGILYLIVPYYIFSKTFIPNLNAHRIYCITEPIQILSILQKQKVEKINEAFQPKIPEISRQYIFADKEIQLINEWAHGKTCKALGLHSMQLHRKLKKYIRNTLENQQLQLENANGENKI